MKNPQNIAITGASSGIGAALARHYAASGITLHLQGRDARRLEAVAGDCRARGASVHTRLCDVTDKAAMAAWLEAPPLDLVIANAGISAGTAGGYESGDQARAIFAANIDGTLNTIEPVLPAMLKRQRGQIALMGSLAGFRGLPSSPAYSASKSALRVWAEGLRGWLSHHGVEVSAICPGYVKTAMTDINDFPMPGIISAEKAAAIIARGLEKNKARIAFPRWFYAVVWLLTLLPPAWTDPLFSRLPGKPGLN